MSRTSYIVSLLALVAGCSSPPEPTPSPPATVTVEPVTLTCPVGSTYEVRVADDLPWVWQHAAVDALATWDRTLAGAFKFRLLITHDVEDPPVTGCVISFFPGGASANAWASTYRLPLHAWGVRPDKATVYIDVTDPRASSDVAYATLLHEFGHVLGLPHDTSRDDLSVMWPAVTVPGRLGCVDEVAACAIWGCTPACSGNAWLE